MCSYLACPALHTINEVPVNLSSNHSLLRQTGGDLTSAFAKKKHCRCPNVYLTMHIHAVLKINTQKYIFLNLPI